MKARQRRYFLKDKETKALLTKASEKFKISLGQIFKEKTGFEVVEADFGDILLVNGKPLMFRIGEEIFPTLVFEEFLAMAPKIIVDMGAVPYVCKGANIMAPGIRRYEGDFEEGDIVLVLDEKHGKAIAVGQSLLSSENAKNAKQGSTVKNIHFVSDNIWNFIKQFTH